MWRVNVGLLGIGVGYVCMERCVNVVNGIDLVHRMNSSPGFRCYWPANGGVSRKMVEIHLLSDIGVLRQFYLLEEDDSELAKILL